MVVSELVQVSPVTSIAANEALSKLEAKMLSCKNNYANNYKGNNLLKQILEEKEQKLSVLENIMDQDKALLEGLVMKIIS